jgi:hypothetical protein
MAANAANGAPAQRRARLGVCQQPECVSARNRLQGMFAAYGIAERERAQLATEAAILRIRAGGDGRLRAHEPRVEPGGDAQTQAQNMHRIKGRLEALRKCIKQQQEQAEAYAVDLLPLSQLREKVERELQEVEEFDETLWNQRETLQRTLEKIQTNVDPYECSICFSPLSPSSLMTGKNCHHFCCTDCVSTAGLTMVKPSYAASNAYWEYTGSQPRADGQGDEPLHTLRSDKEGTFPEGHWFPCPVCREPHYADKAYYDMVLKAHTTLGQDDGQGVAVDTPEAKIAALRTNGMLLLLEAPGDSTKVMAVPAKIPLSPVNPDMPQAWELSGLLRTLGFHFGPVGEGRANWRAKRSDDVIDEMPEGATLRRTEPQNKRVRQELAPDQDGNPQFRMVKQPQGGGTYKVNLPDPAAEAAEAAEA